MWAHLHDSRTTRKRVSIRSPRVWPHVFSSGAFPIILGGDHSIGFSHRCAASAAIWATKRWASSNFDRHCRHPGDRPRRAHAHLPWLPAPNMPTRPAENLVQLGIGGWQGAAKGVKVLPVSAAPTCSPSPTSATWAWSGCKVPRSRRATDGNRLRSTSLLISTARRRFFVPGTGWPEARRPAAARGPDVAGADRAPFAVLRLEVVELSPPYDISGHDLH